jgi:hypothetical protein
VDEADVPSCGENENMEILTIHYYAVETTKLTIGTRYYRPIILLYCGTYTIDTNDSVVLLGHCNSLQHEKKSEKRERKERK